jgi:hypothetical protein
MSAARVAKPLHIASMATGFAAPLFELQGLRAGPRLGLPNPFRRRGEWLALVLAGTGRPLGFARSPKDERAPKWYSLRAGWVYQTRSFLSQ